MAKQFIGTEATGVYVGTLVEDMITTVAREKKLYCNVHIPEFFAKDTDYPLTYVPLWAMSLPLKEGDKVLVEFHQDNLMYPVLYKNPNEIDSGFYDMFDIHKSTDFPSNKDTVGAIKLGDNSYIIKTDNYTVIHQNSGFVLLNSSGNVYVYGNNINTLSSGKTTITADTNITLGTAIGYLTDIIDTILTLPVALAASPVAEQIELWTTDHTDDMVSYGVHKTTINNAFG